MSARTKPHPLAQQNLLDKAIAYFSPKRAQQRMAARAQLAMTGGYTGARYDRAALASWRAGGGSPTTDIIADLPTLRARSRDQMRNAPIAVGALNTTTSHTVGTGLSCNPAINSQFLGLSDEQAAAWQADTKWRFEVWCASKDSSVDRRLNFYGQQSLAYRTWRESGDSFVLTPRLARAGRPARLALQLLEADRVCNPNRTRDTDTLIDGVEVSPETGETIAVHVAKYHPGDLHVKNEWQRVVVRGESTGRLNLLHLFRPLRPGQVRGVPWIAPILEPLKQLSRYTDAELKAAVDSAIFSVFVKMDPDAFDDLFEDDDKSKLIKKGLDWSGELESGKAVNLLPGEEIQSNTPGRPNPQFDPFVQAILRQIGVALEIPFEVLVMHFQSSYSAARGALLMAWKFFRVERDWLVSELCQPVYELWLADEVADGRIKARGFFADPAVRAAWCGAQWTGDGPGSIDPQKEVQAAEKRVQLGISTLESESVLHDGVSWEVKHRQRVKEVRMQQRDGIATAPVAAPAPAPAQAEAGADDLDRETQDEEASTR